MDFPVLDADARILNLNIRPAKSVAVDAGMTAKDRTALEKKLSS